MGLSTPQPAWAPGSVPASRDYAHTLARPELPWRPGMLRGKEKNLVWGSRNAWLWMFPWTEVSEGNSGTNPLQHIPYQLRLIVLFFVFVSVFCLNFWNSRSATPIWIIINTASAESSLLSSSLTTLPDENLMYAAVGGTRGSLEL